MAQHEVSPDSHYHPNDLRGFPRIWGTADGVTDHFDHWVSMKVESNSITQLCEWTTETEGKSLVSDLR